MKRTRKREPGKSQYVLIGGPADGHVVSACDDAKFIVIEFRTNGPYVYADGREFGQAKYKLCGMTGEYMEEPNG